MVSSAGVDDEGLPWLMLLVVELKFHNEVCEEGNLSGGRNLVRSCLVTKSFRWLVLTS